MKRESRFKDGGSKISYFITILACQSGTEPKKLDKIFSYICLVF